jgi:hypothetical protein
MNLVRLASVNLVTPFIICLTLPPLSFLEHLVGSLDTIGKLADNCTGLSRASLSSNASGSGIGSLLLEWLFVDYGMNSKLGFTVYPRSLSGCP